MLPLVVVASLPLLPGQSLRLLGAEILAVGIATLGPLVSLKNAYSGHVDPERRRHSGEMVGVNRFAVTVIALAGLVIFWRGDGKGIYLLPPGTL